jgi:hypothetical protein
VIYVVAKGIRAEIRAIAIGTTTSWINHLMFELLGFFTLFTFLVNLVLSEFCFSSFIVLSLIGLTHGWPETGFLREYFVTVQKLLKTRFLWF